MQIVRLRISGQTTALENQLRSIRAKNTRLRQIYLEHKQFIGITTTNNGNHAAIEELKKENQRLGQRLENVYRIIEEIIKKLPK